MKRESNLVHSGCAVRPAKPHDCNAMAELAGQLGYACTGAPSERARFRIVIVGEARPLHSAVQDQIFLIAREALLNALRHSEARSVEVEIEYLRRKLRLIVRDNGKGIDPQALQSGQNPHRGLTGMRERAASIGAEIQIWSKQGGGTEVEISAPIRGVRVQPAQLSVLL